MLYSRMLKAIFERTKFLISVELIALKCFQGRYEIQWLHIFLVTKPPF